MKQQDKAAALAALAELLDTAPGYGAISLALTVHDGKVSKIETSRSETRNVPKVASHG